MYKGGKFTGKQKQLYRSLFFNKVAVLRLLHRCFPVNYAKFLSVSLLQNIPGRLLLKLYDTAIYLPEHSMSCSCLNYVFNHYTVYSIFRHYHSL